MNISYYIMYLIIAILYLKNCDRKATNIKNKNLREKKSIFVYKYIIYLGKIQRKDV